MTRPFLAAAVLAVSTGLADAGEPKLAFDVIPLFERYDPTYRADRAAARQPLNGLAERVHALETSGSPAIRCAQERLTELRTTVHDTADFARARAETEALKNLLAAPERETVPDGPDREGAWGRCYSQWVLRLDTSYDAISEREAALPVPATFLDRVNGPDALLRYLRGLAVSDIAATGVNHRRELNYSVSALLRLILRDQPIGYPWAPALKDTMRQWLMGEWWSTSATTRSRPPPISRWGCSTNSVTSRPPGGSGRRETFRTVRPSRPGWRRGSARAWRMGAVPRVAPITATPCSGWRLSARRSEPPQDRRPFDRPRLTPPTEAP